MSQNLHPDFKPGISHTEASAADRRTHDFILRQGDAMNAKNWDYAIALNTQMRENQLRVYRPDSAPIAGTYGSLAAILSEAGRLDEAEEAVEKALAMYAAVEDYNEMGLARETLAQIKELQGKFEEAREVRLRVKERREMSCANDKVSLLIVELEQRADCGDAVSFGEDRLSSA